MRLKVRYALRWRTPQTAAVGGSKEEKGQTDGNSAGVSQQTGNILQHTMQEEKEEVHCLSVNCF